jgi:hypothetical protein
MSNPTHVQPFLKKPFSFRLSIGLGIFLAVILVLVIALRFIVQSYLPSVVKSRLTNIVIAATDSLYTLHIDTLTLSADTLAARGIMLVPFRNPPPLKAAFAPTYEISLAALSVVKPSWLNLLSRELYISSISVESPNLFFRELSSDEKNRSRDSLRIDTASGVSFAEKLLEKFVNKIRVDTLRITNAALNYQTLSETKTLKRYDSLVVSLYADRLSLEYNKTASPMLHYDFNEFSFITQPYKREIPNSLYVISLGKISLSVRDSLLSIDSLSVAPAMDDEAFSRKHKFRPTRIRVGASKALLSEIDYKRIIFGGELVAKKAFIDGLRVDVLTDKRLPNPPRIPDTAPLNKVFQKITVKFALDSVIIRNAAVRYGSKQPFVKTGTLDFAAINAALTNLSNFPDRMTSATPLRLDATMLLMHAAHAHAVIELPLLSKTFDMRLHADVAGFNLSVLNKFIEPEGRVKVESGSLLHATVSMTMKNGIARGSVRPTYRNLRLVVLSQDRRKKRGFMEGLMTFVANRYMIKPDNPASKEAVRESKTVYVRRRDESFFETIWKFIWTGCEKVMR